MGVMIFGNPPPFDTVIETLTALENEINGKDVRVYGSGNAQ